MHTLSKIFLFINITMIFLTPFINSNSLLIITVCLIIVDDIIVFLLSADRYNYISYITSVADFLAFALTGADLTLLIIFVVILIIESVSFGIRYFYLQNSEKVFIYKMREKFRNMIKKFH